MPMTDEAASFVLCMLRRSGEMGYFEGYSIAKLNQVIEANRPMAEGSRDPSSSFA